MIFTAFCVATYLVIWPPYPVERGFLCGDVNIRYPLRRETISTSMLVAISLFPVFSLVRLFANFSLFEFSSHICVCFFNYASVLCESELWSRDASGTGQLQANSPVVGPIFSPEKST